MARIEIIRVDFLAKFCEVFLWVRYRPIRLPMSCFKKLNCSGRTLKVIVLFAKLNLPNNFRRQGLNGLVVCHKHPAMQIFYKVRRFELVHHRTFDFRKMQSNARIV